MTLTRFDKASLTSGYVFYVLLLLAVSYYSAAGYERLAGVVVDPQLQAAENDDNAIPAEPANSRIDLISPNGKCKITLEASDHGAGITLENGKQIVLLQADDMSGLWVAGDDHGSMLAVFRGERNKVGIGLYGPPNEGRGQAALTIGMAADTGGGYIQLIRARGGIHQVQHFRGDENKAWKTIPTPLPVNIWPEKPAVP